MVSFRDNDLIETLNQNTYAVWKFKLEILLVFIRTGQWNGMCAFRRLKKESLFDRSLAYTVMCTVIRSSWIIDSKYNYIKSVRIRWLRYKSLKLILTEDTADCVIEHCYFVIAQLTLEIFKLKELLLLPLIMMQDPCR